jgi:hypothetical protein
MSPKSLLAILTLTLMIPALDARADEPAAPPSRLAEIERNIRDLTARVNGNKGRMQQISMSLFGHDLANDPSCNDACRPASGACSARDFSAFGIDPAQPVPQQGFLPGSVCTNLYFKDTTLGRLSQSCRTAVNRCTWVSKQNEILAIGAENLRLEQSLDYWVRQLVTETDALLGNVRFSRPGVRSTITLQDQGSSTRLTRNLSDPMFMGMGVGMPVPVPSATPLAGGGF